MDGQQWNKFQRLKTGQHDVDGKIVPPESDASMSRPIFGITEKKCENKLKALIALPEHVRDENELLELCLSADIL